MSDEELTFTVSSGNVFADLGFPDPDAALAKAKLAAAISGAIVDQGLSQTEAARVLGLTQPKVSALMRGQLRGFSLERLIRCLRALQRSVDIVVNSPSRPVSSMHLGAIPVRPTRGRGQSLTAPRERSAAAKATAAGAARTSGKRKTPVAPA